MIAADPTKDSRAIVVHTATAVVPADEPPKPKKKPTKRIEYHRCSVNIFHLQLNKKPPAALWNNTGTCGIYIYYVISKLAWS
jgi:hypothetical protein